MVAYPVGRPGADSMAAKIAAAWIRSDHQRLPLLFPMVEAAEPRRTAWGAAAQELQQAIRSGQQVALLCEGDASLFASCSYVLLALRQAWPDCPISVIPGITSCSQPRLRASGPSLCSRTNCCCALPRHARGAGAGAGHRRGNGQVLALLKLGRRWSWVQPC